MRAQCCRITDCLLDTKSLLQSQWRKRMVVQKYSLLAAITAKSNFRDISWRSIFPPGPRWMSTRRRLVLERTHSIKPTKSLFEYEQPNSTVDRRNFGLARQGNSVDSFSRLKDCFAQSRIWSIQGLEWPSRCTAKKTIRHSYGQSRHEIDIEIRKRRTTVAEEGRRVINNSEIR